MLLAAARPGQRAPGLTQAVNLAACGLAIRARRILLAGPWQDALAVVSLIAPVLMLISSVLDLAQTVREIVAADQQYPPAAPFWQLDHLPPLAGPTAVLIAWLAVVILTLAAAADRRGDRVRPAGAGPGDHADRRPAAERRLARGTARAAVDGRPGPGHPGQPGGLLAGLLARTSARPGSATC